MVLIPMTDREQILNTIGANKPEEAQPFIMPTVQKEKGVTIEKQFIQMVGHVGGVCIRQHSKQISDMITVRYPHAKKIYSCTKEISSIGFNSENISNPIDLNGVDLAVLQGCFGVAENGAIWISEEEMMHRVLPYIAEHLVILLDHNSIVANMHDAYEQIDLTQVPYGTFISGPSKTADIEQTLVMGAQGPRSHMVILTD